MNPTNQKISRRDAESAEKTWENKGTDPNSSSTLHNRLPIKGLVVTIVLLISLLLLTFVTGTQSLYVDIVNGNADLQYPYTRKGVLPPNLSRAFFEIRGLVEMQ